LLVAGTLSGCYLGSSREFSPTRLEREPGWIALRDVPAIRQKQELDCGAAAVAMVLSYWRVPTSVDTVLARIGPARGHGLRAGRLRDFVRRKGLQAFLFHGTVQDLVQQLQRQRPLIVGLVKARLTTVLPHYEVVVGVHPKKRLVVTLDPALGWRENTVSRFLVEWDRSKRLTLVVLRTPRRQAKALRLAPRALRPKPLTRS
jgi:ABC-type bacteriocin/lantibiotic exporter with double-glycine peptidase domain